MWNPFQLKSSTRTAAPESQSDEIAAQGHWGEEQAAALFRLKGWYIVGRNVRPCTSDRRCEIDLIVRAPNGLTIVFVEVKTHKTPTPRASRLFGINRRKKSVLLRACTNWILRHHWHGNFRFDVVEVYGSHLDSQPIAIDHIENVPLFPPKWRFW